MKSKQQQFSRRWLAGAALTSALCLGASTGFAESRQPAVIDLVTAGTNEVIISDANPSLDLGDGRIIDGNLTVTAGVSIFVRPGVQTVNGNLTLDGAKVIIGFSKKKECGQLKVNGTLRLDSENPPVLALDLQNANLVRGEVYSIFSADEIVGRFHGLGDGDQFQSGDTTLRVGYAGDDITLTVTGTQKDWRRTTPVVEIDASLIDPTSTAPGGW